MSTTVEIVKKIVAEVVECDQSEVQADSKIVDLGADSLDVVDLSFSLGKALNITMPTKTVVVHALEICEDDDLLIKNDRLTEAGAELLRQCPNKYGDDQVKEGTPLIDVFEDTRVQNWVNLCEAIVNSESRNGDVVIRENIERFLSTIAEAAL